ncbi:putative PEP-binding protein [Oceanobacillus sp. 1P07AA]|uniref:putative PEP-binding protein n=1 Tax=Oceanobacillus sp. 1P07AA TaxID=3132293 RepID=UPI0039A65C12
MQIKLSLSGEQVSKELSNNFESGVGLIRGEYLLRKNDLYIVKKAAQVELQEYLYSIAETFYPKPVWYRLIDLWSDEANTLDGNNLMLDEHNPLVGYRGLRGALQNKEASLIELNLIREVAEKWDNLHILFPFVGDTNEFAEGIKLLEEVKWPNKFGTMLEIPSAILYSNDFVSEGASNLLLGLNDLTSLMLGAERGNAFYNKEHKAIKWCIDKVSETKGAEWGIAGNIDSSLLSLCVEKKVPYCSIHYSSLDTLMKIDNSLLPDLGFVKSTKVKTKRRIYEYQMKRCLKDI